MSKKLVAMLGLVGLGFGASCAPPPPVVIIKKESTRTVVRKPVTSSVNWSDSSAYGFNPVERSY